MRYIIFIILTLVFVSCRTARTGTNSNPAPMAPKDSIVFVSMTMWHDSLQRSNRIEVLEVLMKPGTLKRQLVNTRIRDNYLKCLLLSKNEVRDSFLVEHPLYKDVEAVDANNQLSMKRLDLKNAQFFVRFQKKNYNTLVIKENASLIQSREKELKVIRF